MCECVCVSECFFIQIFGIAVLIGATTNWKMDSNNRNFNVIEWSIYHWRMHAVNYDFHAHVIVFTFRLAGVHSFIR